MGLMAALQRFGFLKMTYFRVLLSALFFFFCLPCGFVRFLSFYFRVFVGGAPVCQLWNRELRCAGFVFLVKLKPLSRIFGQMSLLLYSGKGTGHVIHQEVAVFIFYMQTSSFRWTS